MNNYVTSLIRTWVPIGVGAVLSFLATQGDVIVDSDTAGGGILFFTALLTGIYYAVVRWAEIKFPQIGWLLGLAKTPGYSPADPPAESPGPNPDI